MKNKILYGFWTFLIIGLLPAVFSSAQNIDPLVNCLQELKNGGRGGVDSCEVSSDMPLSLNDFRRSEVLDDMNIEFSGIVMDYFGMPEEAKEYFLNYKNSLYYAQTESFKSTNDIENINIGTKSVLIVHKTTNNLAYQYEGPEPMWVTNGVSVSLRVLTGDCFFSVSGNAGYNDKYRDYHHVRPIGKGKFDIVNDGHDHGEAMIRTRVLEYGRNLEKRIAQVCGKSLKGNAAESADSSTSSQELGPSAQKFVEALVESTPTDADLKFAPIQSSQDVSGKLQDKNKGSFYGGWVAGIDGFADIQLPNGTWKPLKVGDKIPDGSKVYTGYDSTMELRFGDHLLIVLRSLSEVDMNILQSTPEAYRTELKLESGALRFKVEETTIKTDMRVSTPKVIAGVVGTDFAVAYDKQKQLSVVEVYDGTVEITKITDGHKNNISTDYGSVIQRVEVAEDGSWVEKIAIPKDEWRMRKAEEASRTDGQKKYIGKLFWFLLIPIFSVGAFMLYKMGRLQPILQKVLAFTRRNDSKTF